MVPIVFKTGVILLHKNLRKLKFIFLNTNSKISENEPSTLAYR